jgi:hypothetical protein
MEILCFFSPSIAGQSKPEICGPDGKPIKTLRHETKDVFLKAASDKADRITHETMETLEWAKSLELVKHYDLNTFYSNYYTQDQKWRASRKNGTSQSPDEKKIYDAAKEKIVSTLDKTKSELLKNLYKKTEAEMGSKTGEPAKRAVEEKASRMLTALSLFGEFRGGRDRRPAHVFWVMEILKNRAHSRSFENRRSVKLGKMNWLNGYLGGAALSPDQFTSWNASNVNNLFSIVAQRDPVYSAKAIVGSERAGGHALQELVRMMSEVEAGIWEPVDKDTNGQWIVVDAPYMDHYDSPQTHPTVRYYRPIHVPAVRNKITGEISEINPQAFEGGPSL